MPDFTKYAFGAGIGGTAVVAFLIIRALWPKKTGTTFNGGNPLRTFEAVPSGRPRGNVTHETF